MELASPITIYWDLPDVVSDDVELEDVCGAIAECRPLMLQLCVGDCVGGTSALHAVQFFENTSVAVSLTVPMEFTRLPGMAIIVALRIKELLMQCASLQSLKQCVGEISALVGGVQQGTTIGVSVTVGRDNWRDLPAMVSHCRQSGINRLVLPMQRLCAGEASFHITAAEQAELATALAAAGGVKGLNLTIHDPFLWRAFHPETPFPQAGCQAANTMIYVAANGNVYPCPTLPLLLGNVRESRLKTIIASPEKKTLRRQLLQAPAGCADCGEVAACRGGCRGRGLVLHGSLDGIDTACQ